MTRGLGDAAEEEAAEAGSGAVMPGAGPMGAAGVERGAGEAVAVEGAVVVVGEKKVV